MKIQTKYLLCTDAFPSVAIRTKLTCEWLCAATEEEDIEINEIIRERANEDLQFVRALQDLVQYILFPVFRKLIVLFVVDLCSRWHTPIKS
jgi:hypothetical protein